MSIRVGIGAGMALPISTEAYWRWVALCEESGIDSIWHSDQLLGQSLEPMAMLAALAGRTKRLRFGMSALVVAFRDPLVVAKQCATIDYLSDGRLLPVFGVGIGQDPYWAATGRAPNERGSRSNEAIMLIRALLEQEAVSFAGAHYRYEGPGVWPRPPKPIPLWIGGDSDAAIRRTAAMGDGWLAGLTIAGKAAEVVVRIKAALASTGRQIENDHYGVTVPFRIGEPDDPAVIRMRRQLAARLGLSGAELPEIIAGGSAEAIIAHFRGFTAAGIAKFVAVPIAHDADDLLDQTRQLAQDVVPAIEDR